MKQSILILLGLAAAVLLPMMTPSTYFHHLLVLWVLYAILALSLNIVIGYLGELSFGHAAFFGIGAYASALTVMDLGMSPVLGLVAATVVAGIIGGLIGFAALRIVGPQFAILTLGFGSILYTICNYWIDLTRGPMGISGIPYFGLSSTNGIESALGYYYLVLAVMLGFIFMIWALMRAPLGRAFIATRENAPLAASLGINTFQIKLIGFVIATAVAGLAGGLYAHYVRVITPELMGLQYMTAIIVILMVGGRGTILGPILGAFIYIGLLELLRPLGSLRLLIFATLLILTVIFLPRGLIGLVPERWFKSQSAKGAHAK